MSVTVKKQYLCGYHCQSCGWFNIEAGETEARADVQTEAAELAQRLFQNIKSGVNQRTEYGVPGIKGVCRKCGAKQVWSSRERKTSMAEKALFAMMGVSLVIGAVGMLIYQNLLPVLLGSVLAMALLGVELRMTSRVNKAYRESVCKQVDEELSSVIGWNPYPYVAASDDAADPSDERSVKLAQHMESLHNNRSPSLSATKYGEELVKKMQANGAKAYLVNTGWNGTGKRITIKDTRGIIDAILSGDILKAPTKKIPYFDFEVPTELPGVDSKILDPRDTYADASEWENKAKDLASRFEKNFVKYTGNDAGKALVEAGPHA